MDLRNREWIDEVDEVCEGEDECIGLLSGKLKLMGMGVWWADHDESSEDEQGNSGAIERVSDKKISKSSSSSSSSSPPSKKEKTTCLNPSAFSPATSTPSSSSSLTPSKPSSFHRILSRFPSFRSKIRERTRHSDIEGKSAFELFLERAVEGEREAEVLRLLERRGRKRREKRGGSR